jgi:thiamine-monophosphate kinase
MHEASIISEFFLNKNQANTGVITGIGDDGAVLALPANQQLVISMDTLNAGVHFPYPANAALHQCIEPSINLNTTDAFSIGYKAAAVNLSDMAAMGATPLWATLSLSLPEINLHWLEQFSEGLFSLLNPHNVALVGGDLNRGSLSMTIQLHGSVPAGQALLRSTAQAGDVIVVSGEVGSAAYALDLLQTQPEHPLLAKLLPALKQPTPRVALGKLLLGVATSAMDLSDGLSMDLSRLLNASHCGAVIYMQTLPINPILHQALSSEAMCQYAFTGGDDYELCFTLPKEQVHHLDTWREQLDLPLTEIGYLTRMPGITLLNAPENAAQLKQSGYGHFS